MAMTDVPTVCAIERPIIFDAESVRAILAGEKSQTRRVMREQPSDDWQPHNYGELHKIKDGDFVKPLAVCGWGPCDEDGMEGYRSPYGKPGDLLWVREAFIRGYPDDGNGHIDMSGPRQTFYKADRSVGEWEDPERGRLDSPPWISPLFMPRYCSRITLRVTSVRVERLQEISEAEARAEGVKRVVDGIILPGSVPPKRVELTHRHYFADRWNSINGSRFPSLPKGLTKAERDAARAEQRAAGSPYRWDANPWVWAIEFERVGNAAKEARDGVEHNAMAEVTHEAN